MSALERWLLWTSTAVVALTGFVYAWMKYLMTTTDPYAVVNHPLQPLVLTIHIVAAPFLVFGIGLVFAEHIWKQWRMGLHRGRRSGLFMLSTFVPMVLSGYLLQAVTHEGWLWSLVIVHLVVGTIFVIGFVAHQVAQFLRAAAAARRAVGMAARRRSRGSQSAPLRARD